MTSFAAPFFYSSKFQQQHVSTPQVHMHPSSSFLFAKQLTQSDLQESLLIPKYHAELFFPLLNVGEKLQLRFTDGEGRVWQFCYCHWTTKYVFSQGRRNGNGWAEFRTRMKLQVKDKVVFYWDGFRRNIWRIAIIRPADNDMEMEMEMEFNMKEENMQYTGRLGYPPASYAASAAGAQQQQSKSKKSVILLGKRIDIDA